MNKIQLIIVGSMILHKVSSKTIISHHVFEKVKIDRNKDINKTRLCNSFDNTYMEFPQLLSMEEKQLKANSKPKVL